MSQESQSANNDVEFRVLIRGLKIDPAAHERINKAIRQVVLKEIASLDFEGDLKIGAEGSFEKARALGSSVGRFSLGTAGVTVRAEQNE